MSGSTDAALKKALNAKITSTRSKLDLVRSSENGQVFKTNIDNIPFDDFDVAYEYCKQSDIKKSYNIEKYRVLSSGNGSSLEITRNHQKSYVGGVLFNKQNEIIYVWDEETEFPNKYTDGFIHFANPFERGDIVRNCTNGEIYIVETSQSEWNDYLKRSENNKAYNFWDSSLTVQFLDNEGFRYSRIQTIYLEKLPLDKKGVPKCFDIKNNINEVCSAVPPSFCGERLKKN